MVEPSRDDAPTAQFPPVPPPETDEPPIRHVRLFGSHAFFRLWLAQVVSALGDWLGFVAIVAVAGRVGRSESAISLVMIARMVPGFFFGPVAGVLVDRWDRKRVMISCDVFRGLVLATVPFIDTVWGLVIASLLLEVPTLMWSPAKEATVPKLVRSDYLATANSLSLVAAYGTFPLATAVFAALAGVAKWLGGYESLDFLRPNQESIALYFDVLTFFLSALMIFTLPLARRTPAERDAPSEGRRVELGKAFSELKEGWSVIAIDPVVRAVMVAIGTGLIGGGMLVPLGPKFSNEVLGSSSAGFGLLLTALGTGVAVGVIALSPIQRRLPRTTVFTVAVFGAGGLLFAAASVGSLELAFPLVVGLGVCGGAVYILGFTILQETVQDEFRGRIFSALYTLVRLCLLIAFALAGFLSRALDYVSDRTVGRSIEIQGVRVFLPGVRLSLWLAAGFMVAAGVLAVLSLRAGRRRDRAIMTPP